MIRFITLIFLATLYSLSAKAAIVTIDPDNCGVNPGDLTCYYSNTTSNLGTSSEIEAAFSVNFDPDLTFYYKSESVDGQDSGTDPTSPFSGSYDTTFKEFEDAAGKKDPNGADIIYNQGTTAINCPECYLIVKDGDQGDPAQYLIDLGSWNGLDTLALTGFWDSGHGSISNVAIWGRVSGLPGPSPVPVPAAVWLFGTALIGFIGVSRRTKV